MGLLQVILFVSLLSTIDIEVTTKDSDMIGVLLAYSDETNLFGCNVVHGIKIGIDYDGPILENVTFTKCLPGKNE